MSTKELKKLLNYNDELYETIEQLMSSAPKEGVVIGGEQLDVVDVVKSIENYDVDSNSATHRRDIIVEYKNDLYIIRYDFDSWLGGDISVYKGTVEQRTVYAPIEDTRA